MIKKPIKTLEKMGKVQREIEREREIVTGGRYILVITLNEWLTTTHHWSGASISQLKYKGREESDLLGRIKRVIPMRS